MPPCNAGAPLLAAIVIAASATPQPQQKPPQPPSEPTPTTSSDEVTAAHPCRFQLVDMVSPSMITIARTADEERVVVTTRVLTDDEFSEQWQRERGGTP